MGGGGVINDKITAGKEGGGGFFVACKDFGRNVPQFIPDPRLRFFFFKWRLAGAH